MLGTKAELKKNRFYQEIEEEIHDFAKEKGKKEAEEALLLAGVPIGIQAGLSVIASHQKY
jgi:predicted transposase YdaD